MDSQDPCRVALLSIKPDYAAAIFEGRKTVEFRRSRIAPDINIAIVYATQPVGKIIGWFHVSGVAKSTPDGLWRRFRGEGAIRRRDYFAYFDGADHAYGIEISHPTKLEMPLLLDQITPGLRAPQSFQYLSAHIAELVVSQRPCSRKRLPALRAAFA